MSSGKSDYLCLGDWFSVALRPQRRVGLLGTGTQWEGDERVKDSTAETARKRPERPWTAARTMKVLSPFLIGRMFLREPSWKYSANLVGS